MNEVYIHPSAHVSGDAKIGVGTKVWINVQIREGTQIGGECIISKDVYIDYDVQIGDRCKIQNSVSVYNGVTIKDEVFVGPNVSFTNDKVPRAVNVDWKVTPTLIEQGASIGANATILCGTVIGQYAMVAAGSVVTKSVPAHALVMGNPANVVGYVCVCGSRLNSEGLCLLCGRETDMSMLGETL